MGRPKGVTTKPVCFSLNKDVVARLDAYHDATDVPKTKIVENGIMTYLDQKGFMVESSEAADM